MKSSFAVIGVILLVALAAEGAKVVRPLAFVFTDNMVLQRDLPLPVWGAGKASENVVVEFAGQTKTVQAGADGQWLLKLDPLPASAAPREMKITVGSQTPVILHNVLVGEVWIGSGQSNMALPADDHLFAEDKVLAELVAGGPYAQLRLFGTRNQDGWKQSAPENNKGFSAQMLAFGVNLQKDLGVPVGLIVGAAGSSPSGGWLAQEMFDSDEGCRQAAERADKQAEADYRKVLLEWDKEADMAPQQGLPEPPKPAVPLKAGSMKMPVGDLYRRWIKPVVPYGIRGVLWDQGEAGTAMQLMDQYTVMGGLIRGWRKEWGQGEFPFVYVQKPSGGGCAWDYADPVTKFADTAKPLPSAPPADGGEREMYIRLREFPHTAMSTTSDLGSALHPVCKSGYGTRAARVALAFVYGRKHEMYGPIYQSHQVVGNKIRIIFTHTGQGLAFRNADKLQGFAIAGADKRFVWADAQIDGDSVVVSSPQVANPVAVRYAWSGRMSWANLFNKDGLPALTFRTDDRPVIAKGDK